MKVLHPKIWVISPKNEGFGFPWVLVAIAPDACCYDANALLVVGSYEILSWAKTVGSVLSSR